jgi:hypothetical protein
VWVLDWLLGRRESKSSARRAVATQPPSATAPRSTPAFAVIDVETTGLSANRCERPDMGAIRQNAPPAEARGAS